MEFKFYKFIHQSPSGLKTYTAIRVAKTLEEAWQKTIEKWWLSSQGCILTALSYGGKFCGFCDYARSCCTCQISQFCGHGGCDNFPYSHTGFYDKDTGKYYDFDPQASLMYLLLIREIMKDPKFKP